MLDKLNLSSKPFRNRTLPYLIAAAVIVVAFLGAVVGFSQYRSDIALNKVVKGDVDKMAEKIDSLKKRGTEIRNELTLPQQQLLIAAHTLVAHKDFSWSRLLTDLETVLPGDVSASRINVQRIYRDGDQLRAEIEFSVLAKNYQGVLEMIRRMNNSGIFRASLRGQDLQKGESITYSEYTLHLVYSPRAGYASAPAADIAKNSAEGGER